jgi:hypothetical protein
MTLLISRRLALVSGALSLASLAATGGSFARQRGPVSAVRVDVGPLRASGSTEFADWVAQMLPDELQKSLARQWAASGGGTVVAQINAVQLRVSGNRSAIGRSRAGSRNTRTDTIDGNLSLLDASGGTITRAHLFTTRPSPSITATAPSENDRRLSVAALCQTFAHWTPGRLGL